MLRTAPQDEARGFKFQPVHSTMSEVVIEIDDALIYVALLVCFIDRPVQECRRGGVRHGVVANGFVCLGNVRGEDNMNSDGSPSRS